MNSEMKEGFICRCEVCDAQVTATTYRGIIKERKEHGFVVGLGRYLYLCSECAEIERQYLRAQQEAEAGG